MVSTDVGDVGRMVAPSNARFVTSSEDGLAQGLATLIADEALRRRIGAANKAKCRLDYSLSGMIDAWRSLLERQIGRAA